MKTIKLTLLSLVFALSALAADGATVVTAEGVGEVAYRTKETEPAVFEEARLLALRHAVEQVAGVRIDSDTVVLNNQLVRDQVLSKTSGYVKSSEVLDKKVEKGTVSVKVRAQIITENLDKDIEAARTLVKRIGRPKLVIVIQEQTLTSGGKAVNSSEALASVLTEAFKADGWDVKDEQAVNKSLNLGGAITLGPTEVKRIAELAKVDYVLYGKASIRHEPPPEMMKDAPFFPVAGEYDLSLAATDTGSQITKVAGPLTMSLRTGETSISYERTALRVIKERKNDIVGPVRKAVLEHFRDQEANGRDLEVSVKGIDSVTAAREFNKAIETITGIKEASQHSFANGTAQYRVVYFGSPDDLAVKLEASTFKKKKVLVVSQTGNTLEVQVGK